MGGAPKMLSDYCGWSQHKDHKYACRLQFSGDKVHVQWKKDGHSVKGCSLCGKSRKVDCKDEHYKVSHGSGLTSGLAVSSDGYDIQFTDTKSSSDCLRKDLGESKKAPNHVPIRIKIFTGNTHLSLKEAKNQDDHNPDGASCDMVPDCKAHKMDGCRDCSTWDQGHKANCRRRAGCHSLAIPVPQDEIDDDDDEIDEYDIEDFGNEEVV